MNTVIDGLGAYKTENAISRTSKAMGVVAEIIKSYDSALKVCEASAIHHDISFKNYLKKFQISLWNVMSLTLLKVADINRLNFIAI